jgi:hypothetical protein
MIIKSNGKTIHITPDGSIKIDDKHYYDNKAYLKSIHNALIPLLEKDSSINYNDIPYSLRKKINKSLNNVFENLQNNEEGIIALNHLKEFGILAEKKAQLKSLSLSINNSLFKLGLGDLDKFYFNNKKEKLEFIEKLNTNGVVNHVAINKFVAYYKENKLNDFKFFNETLQDYGLKNQSDILKHYNDHIDESFKLDSKEFGLISVVKRDLMELQNKVIKDAISSGLDVPVDLPRFISPSDKIKDELINPEKVKFIQRLSFENGKYKSSNFNEDHSVSSSLREKFIKELKTQEKIVNIDTNDNVDLIRLQILNNNGFSFDRMRNWALNYKSDIVGPQRTMLIAQSGIKYCNKLVECGILQTSNYEDFTFTSPRAREILLENPNATFNELADEIIKEFKSEDVDVDGKSFDTISKEVYNNQRKEFYAFLDAQYESFYKPQDITIDKFKEDILKDDSAELKRLNDLYPALKDVNYSELVEEYYEQKIYDYDRTSTFDFSNKKNQDELLNKWKEIQVLNRNKSEDDLETTSKFINISAVRFGGVSLSSLENWKDNVSLPGNQAEKFVQMSIEQAKELVSIGILKTSDNENFSFVDNYAKEVLYKNFDKTINELEILNFGEKRLKDEIISSKEISQEDKGKLKQEQFIDNLKSKLSERVPEKQLKDILIEIHGNNIKMSLNEKETFFSINDKSLENKNIDKFLSKIGIPKETPTKETPAKVEVLTMKDINAAKKTLVHKLNKDSNAKSEDYIKVNEFIAGQKQLLTDGKLDKKQFEESLKELNQGNKYDSILNKLLIFNNNYEKSSSKEYIKFMRDEEKELSEEIENACIKNKDFKESLIKFCDGDNIDSYKYFFLSNLLDNINDETETKELLKDNTANEKTNEVLG